MSQTFVLARKSCQVNKNLQTWSDQQVFMCHLWMSKSEPPNKSPEWQTRPVCMSEMDEYSLSLRYNAEIKQTIQVSIEPRFFCQKKIKKVFFMLLPKKHLSPSLMFRLYDLLPRNSIHTIAKNILQPYCGSESWKKLMAWKQLRVKRTRVCSTLITRTVREQGMMGHCEDDNTDEP